MQKQKKRRERAEREKRDGKTKANCQNDQCNFTDNNSGLSKFERNLGLVRLKNFELLKYKNFDIKINYKFINYANRVIWVPLYLGECVLCPKTLA